MNLIDGRKFLDKEVNWKEIKVGDVVIEGKLENHQYRIITSISGIYWEYFSPIDGYYHSTTPDHAKYLVIGQKDCDGGYIYKISNPYKEE